jgi:hypothetical protein
VPLDEEGKRDREEVVSGFERDSELAAKELAKSRSATAQESDRSNYNILEGPGHGSLLRSQDQEQQDELLERQRQVVAADTTQKVVDRDSEPE